MGEIPNWELFITYQNCYSRNKMVSLNRDLHFQFPSQRPPAFSPETSSPSEGTSPVEVAV